MSNIDKDIEILEELITHKDDYDVAYGYRFEKPCQIGSEKINAIENVLADRETWKKTAEKLAKKLAGTIKYDYMFETICSDIPEFYECGQEGIYKTNRINCFKCLLDWARKEVEKDVKD